MHLTKFSNFKRVAAIIAAVFVVCLTCITAFAENVDPAIVISGSGEYSLNVGANNSYFFDVEEDWTITNITAPESLAVSYDDGTTWTQLTTTAESEYTFTADGKVRVQGVYNSYTYRFEITTPDPNAGILFGVSQFVGGFITNATSLATWIMQTPLALIGVIAWVLILFVGILAKYIKQ